MVLRKQNEIDKFIEFINREWSLSVNEETVLESILNLFLAQNIKEIKKVEHLLNDETEELLGFLDSYDIQRYCERNFDMVAECDECDECKDLEDYDDEDLLDEVESRDLNWQDYDSNTDIVTQSDLEEMTELFLNLSAQKRQEAINNLK